MAAAVTTTVLGMGSALSFSGLRESLGLVPAVEAAHQDPGELRWVHAVSRIRAARTTESEIVGRLAPGDSVRVDFADAGWYAVFPTSATRTTEETALGYVFGRLLKEEPPPHVQLPLVRILP